jgi:hypothetical protein
MAVTVDDIPGVRADIVDSRIRFFIEGRSFASFKISEMVWLLEKYGFVERVRAPKKEDRPPPPDNAIPPEAMVEAYMKFGLDLTGQYPAFIKKGNRHWASMVRAGEICAELGLQPFDYVSRISKELSKMEKRKSGKDSTVIPWPGQLGNNSVYTWISQSKADKVSKKASTNDAATLAKKNEGLSLKEDKHYIECFERAKAGTHTAADVEYCRLRQLDMEGKEFKWIAKYAPGGEKAPKQ